MSSEPFFQHVQNSHPLLQASLDRSWQEFQETETFTVIGKLADQISWWRSSEYQGIIPYPAH